jgi:hypothetical protein
LAEHLPAKVSHRKPRFLYGYLREQGSKFSARVSSHGVFQHNQPIRAIHSFAANVGVHAFLLKLAPLKGFHIGGVTTAKTVAETVASVDAVTVIREHCDGRSGEKLETFSAS